MVLRKCFKYQPIKTTGKFTDSNVQFQGLELPRGEGEGWGLEKIPSVAEVGIFSGPTQ